MESQLAFPASFGELLHTFRKRKRLTQKQLAQQLGVHANTISSWELGTYLPATRGLVLELARHLALDEQETRQLLEASLTALSPHWLVPLPRNPFFTGREGILEALHTHLRGEQVVALTQSYALRGLGGIGKTQIALEYAYRHALEYSAIFWIEAETIDHVMSSLLRIAEVLQLPGRDDKDQQRVAAAVQRWLTTHSQWLLIWDNVEDLAMLDRFLPPAKQGAVLVTTRCHALGTFARGMDLLPMKHEEGMLFLLRRAKVLEPEASSEQVRQLAVRMPPQYTAAAGLVMAMGGLPLALDQAGAYLEETQCGLPAYLELFRTRRAALLQQRGEGSCDHPASVSATFTLAIMATAGRHPAVGDLLRVCAVLQPDAIPEEFFRQGAGHLGAMLEAACRDELEWNRVVGLACSFSLLHRQPAEQTFSMHRLVQAILQEGMSEQERTEFRQRAVHALTVLFPEVTYDTWQQCERLLSHVLVVSAAIPEHAEDQELAELLQKAADYLRMRAQYEPARSLYERALRIREQALGPDHPDVASPLYGLGLLCWKQGKYAQAKLLYQRALSIQEQAKGTEHTKIAHLLNGLAILSVEQGKHEQAEPLYQQALAIREHQLGPEHPDRAESLNNLADLYIKQGKYEQAEPLCEQALSIWKRALGAEHPQVAFPFRHLADLYMEQGKYEQAEPLYQQALHIWEQALGPEHPQVAYAFHGLAILFTRQGKYEQAEPLYQQALHIWEQALGPEHPQMAHPLNNLAVLYTAQGKYEQAELLFQRALSLREQHFGQHHSEIAQTLHDLAICYQKQGNLSEAISLTERALEIRSQSLGDAHPKTVATRALYTQYTTAKIR